MAELLSSIEAQMSLLLFFSLTGYLVAARINQSAVIGLILIGLVIGPSFLGWITATDFVQAIAHLGVIILLFVIGLEFKLKDIINVKYGIIALFGILVPWVAGYFLALAFGFNSNIAIFVGVALTATSIAITANVLKEMGKLQTDVAKAIIGAAVIDDILGLLALSISTQIISNAFSILDVTTILIKAAGFLVIGAYAGHKFLSKLVVRVDKTKISQSYPEFVFIFAMMLAFLYATLAEVIGLSSIVGAFIAGVSLGSVSLKHGKDYKAGAEYLHIIFASVFFISLGILADLKFLTPNTIVFITLLTVLGVASKVIGCGIPARLQGMSLKNSLIVGVGMVPRGEVAMIVALIGLNQNIFGQEIYVSLVLMSLLTTIIAPIILRNLFGKQEISSYRYKLKK